MMKTDELAAQDDGRDDGLDGGDGGQDDDRDGGAQVSDADVDADVDASVDAGVDAGANGGANGGAIGGAIGGADEGTGQPNFVAFRVSGQDYCVDILAVREISQRIHITPLPKSPRFISGVINLRGSVVPVLDCQIRFGLKPRQTPTRQVIIVVQIGERMVGLLVDEVTEILNISHEAIKPIPDTEDAVTPPLVSGIIVKDARIIRHIDLAQVVPEKELATA